MMRTIKIVLLYYDVAINVKKIYNIYRISEKVMELTETAFQANSSYNITGYCRSFYIFREVRDECLISKEQKNS
ncbi:hypothetical protein AN618_15360 [Fervidicola ferrireducens]|uniref:Uncharacterized protein n=1 Tax=Fervidicola ferrireducens TaxID=520764 RepID=A0A140L7W8_9FIRM|nr:hypothetical protein AN618_15360 [Fervidicola ferrireducens]